MERLEELSRSGCTHTIIREYKVMLPNFVNYLRSITKIRIQPICNWTSTHNLLQTWKKMSRNQSLSWGRIEMVETDPDFWLIINTPKQDTDYDPKRTIITRMEPFPIWDYNETFYKTLFHTTHLNLLEWHLSKTYEELVSSHPQKEYDHEISAILSARYVDTGHKKRVNFIKELEKYTDVHVYGTNAFSYRCYKGPLPYHKKDAGLLPYKYTITAENNSIHNYCTEKITDAVLAECLCFYWGCPNLETILDPMCFVRLDMETDDIETVLDMISNGEWEKRIDIIRKEKMHILNNLQLFPFLERVLEN